MIEFFIASVIIINPYLQTPVVSVGAGGNILQEDGVSVILQQDGVSAILQESTPGGNILKQDGFFLFKEDGTSKIKQEE